MQRYGLWICVVWWGLAAQAEAGGASPAAQRDGKAKQVASQAGPVDEPGRWSGGEKGSSGRHARRLELALSGGAGFGWGGGLRFTVKLAPWIGFYLDVSGYNAPFTGAFFPEWRYGTLQFSGGVAFAIEAGAWEVVVRMGYGASVSFIGPVSFAANGGVEVRYRFDNGLFLGLGSILYVNYATIGGNDGWMIAALGQGSIGWAF